MARMKKADWIALTVIILLAIIITVFQSKAHAEAGFSVMYAVPDNPRVESGNLYKLDFGKTVYAVAQMEEHGLNLVGQSIGKTTLWGAGAGIRKEVQDLTFSAEFLYYIPDTSTNQKIRDEAVLVNLTNTHGGKSTYFENTSYSLSKGYGGTFSVQYSPWNHVAIVGSYRFLHLEEKQDAWTGECSFPVTSSCTAWFQEREHMNLNMFLIGVRMYL